MEVSSTNQLAAQLSSVAQYGTGSNLYIESCDQIKSEQTLANKFFALIPANKITRIGDSSVRYTLVVDEEACNGLVGVGEEELNLNEVGLFMKNPKGSSTNASLLTAYRTFSNIYKTSDFSLIFRWTLNF